MCAFFGSLVLFHMVNLAIGMLHTALQKAGAVPESHIVPPVYFI